MAERYHLELVPLPGDWPHPAIRLRRLLRSARRSHGFRAVAMTSNPGPDPAGHQDPERQEVGR